MCPFAPSHSYQLYYFTPTLHISLIFVFLCLSHIVYPAIISQNNFWFSCSNLYFGYNVISSNFSTKSLTLVLYTLNLYSIVRWLFFQINLFQVFWNNCFVDRCGAAVVIFDINSSSEVLFLVLWGYSGFLLPVSPVNFPSLSRLRTGNNSYWTSQSTMQLSRVEKSRHSNNELSTSLFV